MLTRKILHPGHWIAANFAGTELFHEIMVTETFAPSGISIDMVIQWKLSPVCYLTN
jgi:hypothetical protein